MSAEEVLRESDNGALYNNQIISHVTGERGPIKSDRKKLRSFSAAAFITIMIVVFAVLFNLGTLVPSALSERLIEETDMQYADAVESKKIVFQQAMQNGELPENTIRILKENGVLVGTVENGDFVEGNDVGGELSLKMGDKIISASDFIREVSSNVALYNAFNNATYSRTAYYYDEAGKEVFEKIGTNRHNYTDETDFNQLMQEKMGSGSDLEIGSVLESDDSYSEDGGTVSSKINASDLVEAVRKKNPASSANKSAVDTADALKAAETDVRNKRSALFYSLIMEPISQMKAEDGNDVLNQMMNYLTNEEDTYVVDVKTGELVKMRGSALDAPDLYAILSGEKPNMERSGYYSSDRILKTVENLIGGDGEPAIKTTVASTSKGTSGLIGRLIGSGSELAPSKIVSLVAPAVSKSLVDNSYEQIQGIDAGEFLVEGAVNTGRMLAQASGGTAGDAEAVTKYARLNSSVIAMDAAVDRMNRSPFDVTSKNTFLGSIIYKLAVSTKFNKGNILGKVASTMTVGVRSFASIVMPGAYADSENGYLTNFGDCETAGTYGAVGSSTCAQIATFDTSTLNDPFNDAGFRKFVEENTTLSGGTRSIKDGSVLARFVLYNTKETPFGVTDGGILESLQGGASSIPVVSDIISMITSFIGASDSEKAIATGAAFVNSGANSEWQRYKYAQRYVSLARATAALRQYSNNSSAYNNIEYFEGDINPVIAYLDHYRNIANR